MPEAFQPNLDFTAVGLVNAREDLHERGLSGTVFADQCRDGAARQREGRTLERAHSPE